MRGAGLFDESGACPREAGAAAEKFGIISENLLILKVS